ncbi:glutathione S-transferase family protein [Zavarzinia sp. CC-PAN008]|uniref:glutathione S-transferase family protein n=1 Tax=Zavarzinia sp. CC-PAN008 TaxID=3243332 RepID=UPI003F746864
MAELILHHYPSSPFSEKVRAALGIKGVAWRSVTIPVIMPKPDLMPLTGGYRRTPVMQIGAEIWCDTQVILREIERRFPEPPLLAGADGLSAMVSFWADKAFFMATVATIYGTIADSVPRDFVEDRKHLSPAFSIEQMRAAAPFAIAQVRAQIGWIDLQLADGRPYLMGERPTMVDLHPYHVVWFLRTNYPGAAALLADFPACAAWLERIKRLGHGRPADLDPREALAIARDAEPDMATRLGPGEPFRIGQAVNVMPDDYGRDPVAGTIVVADAYEIAIRREDPVVGEVVVHFPRAGFVVTPA